jgi:flagellar hook-associated protein 3 FlgL
VRITERSISTNTLNNLQKSLGRSAKLQEQLSSGKLVSRPSDSPASTVATMQVRSESRAVQQYARNANDGMAWLSSLDTTLTSASTQVGRARDLVLQGLNGAASSASRQTLAEEIDNIRESLIGLANTTYLDRPIFGGNTADRTAYTSGGVYSGDAGEVNRTVGDGSTVRVNLTGPEVFGVGADDLFNVLSSISDKLKNDPAAARAELGRLDTVTEKMRTAMAQVGARYNRVESMKLTADDRLLTLNTQQSEFEDIDLPQTIMEMQLQETAYQAALAATAKVIQPSLVDFLR